MATGLAAQVKSAARRGRDEQARLVGRRSETAVLCGWPARQRGEESKMDSDLSAAVLEAL
jgi:hypothetical protein